MPTATFKVPAHIATQVKEAAFRLADEHAYLARSQPENRQFILNLLQHEQVGKVLEQYLEKAEIKTYIKDAILNKYSKAKLKESAAIDRNVVLRAAFNTQGAEVATKERVSLHRLETGEFAVISLGSLAKWETALRKAAEFINRCDGLTAGPIVRIIILIAADEKKLTSSDRDSIRSAISLLGGTAVFTDECNGSL